VYTGNYFVIIVVDTITIGPSIPKWQAVVINIIYGGTVQRVLGRNYLSFIVIPPTINGVGMIVGRSITGKSFTGRTTSTVSLASSVAQILTITIVIGFGRRKNHVTVSLILHAGIRRR